MLIQCLLGRILPVEGQADAQLLGVRNSTKWLFEITHEGGPATVQLRLIDWRTGKPIPKGMLTPVAVPQSPEAAKARIYFPICEDGCVSVSVEQEPVPESPDVVSASPVRFRLAVDAVHSLMR